MTEGKNTGKKSNKKSIPKPKILNAEQFIAEFAKKQDELINAMLACIHHKEIEIVEDGADDYIEDILGNYNSKDEPDYASHLQASGAIFLWALLDQAYGDEVNEAENGQDAEIHDGYSESEPVGPNQAHPGYGLASDVLKTVRSIWGKHA